MKAQKLLLSLLAVCFHAALFAQIGVGDSWPEWTEGYMDIHHINTGRGECAFAILPDGTTMLVDAGETGAGPSITPAKPDDSRSAGEWITRYIARMMRPLPEKKLDYILLTHFHDDHIGDVELARKKSARGDYMLSGITEVGDNIPFGKIVDRDWPDYDYPAPMGEHPNMKNYLSFVGSHVAGGATAERFEVGSGRQFTLLRRPDKYPGFEIRNIAANGVVWTGVQDNVREHFPPVENLSPRQYPNENMCSSAFRLSYGRFDYFNGADITCSDAGTWRDIETPVGQVTGPAEVCLANHHAYWDAMGVPFLQAVRPSVFIIQSWSASHPNARTLAGMISTNVYPGPRDIFSTNLMKETRTVVGSRLDQLKSTQGHIVVRVHPGGDTFMIYVLDDSSESFTVRSVHGPYTSR